MKKSICFLSFVMAFLIVLAAPLQTVHAADPIRTRWMINEPSSL